MNREEYYRWKKDHPEEFETIADTVMKEIKDDVANHNLDDVMYQSPIRDKNRRCVTYGDALRSLECRDEIFDELCRIEKSCLDYIEIRKNE